MIKLIACGVICCGILPAQAGLQDPRQNAALDRLRADISSLAKAGLTSTEKLADDIMALAETPQPPRSVVQAFADNLIHALVGKPLHNHNLVRQLATGIQKTLESAGTSTIRFHETIAAAKNAMRGLGISESRAQRLAIELKAIGDKVRGPEDIPLTSVT
ncbi:MAG: hypothetical protein JWO48_1355 [Bryobacterales bacterium]|nr:hypothetical protein [Bryobacterales bacterium]